MVTFSTPNVNLIAENADEYKVIFVNIIKLTAASECSRTKSHNKKIGPNERGGGGVKTEAAYDDAIYMAPAWLVLTTSYWPLLRVWQTNQS